METIKINTGSEFSTYPTNRMCAIIETDMDARSAMDEMLRSGIKPDHIQVYYGPAGIETLDAEGTHHGVAAKIATQLRAYGDVENETLRIYEGAMKNGEFVFEVLAETDEEKEHV